MRDNASRLMLLLDYPILSPIKLRGHRSCIQFLRLSLLLWVRRRG